MSDDWRCVFSRDTPWAELQDIINEQIRDALHVFLDTLLDHQGLSDRERAAAWACGAPHIREQHRTALERAWTDLQLQAPASNTVQ